MCSVELRHGSAGGWKGDDICFLHARIDRFVCGRMRLTILTYVEYVFFCFLSCSVCASHTTTLFGRPSSLRASESIANAGGRRVAAIVCPRKLLRAAILICSANFVAHLHHLFGSVSTGGDWYAMKSVRNRPREILIFDLPFQFIHRLDLKPAKLFHPHLRLCVSFGSRFLWVDATQEKKTI